MKQIQMALQNYGKFLQLLLLLAILSAGCASTHPTVGAWRDAGFSPKRTDKIAFALRPNPNSEDAELGRLLTAELKREGFNIVPAAEADYTLAYVVEDDSTEHYLPERDFTVGGPPQRTPNIVVPSKMPPPGLEEAQLYTPPSISPGVVVFHNKGLRLFLYTNPKAHGGNLQLAWSGCIEAGETVSSDREPLLIKTLLGYFGENYVGRVDLNPQTP